MNNQVLVIVNPKAGKGRVQKKIPDIQKDLIKTGYNVDVIRTQKKFSAKDIIKKYNKKIDILLCCRRRWNSKRFNKCRYGIRRET